MKKFLSYLCAAAMLVSLTACSKSTGSAPHAGESVTGQVTAISDSTVTLQLGELTQAENDNDTNGNPPALPGSTDNASTDGAGSGNMQGSTPPEKPEGDSMGGGQTPPDADSSSNGGTPPEMPGGMPGGTVGTARSFMAGDETLTVDLSSAVIVKDSAVASLDDVAEDDVLLIVFGGDGKAAAAILVTLGGGAAGEPDQGFGAPGQGMGGFGGSAEVTQGDSANTISEDGTYNGTSYTSTGDDENALRIDGAAVTLDGITVEKSAGATSNTENGDFYGMNAALLATNGATVTIRNAMISSAAQNGNGVFSYGSGTTVNISDSIITTTADNSGGIQTTGGGTTNASNLTVSTFGNSSAAIRSDRGGGTANVAGGSYTSNGYNSPAVYSTADISVSDAVLTANQSEALVIEGKNSITLDNCTVTGSMSSTNAASADENVHNVMIYQSMSGDADVGTSTLTMTGGSLTGKSGDLFYVTNTHCVLTLSGVTLQNEAADTCLLRVAGNSASRGWGTAGSNGAQVAFTADAQTLTGDIVVDSISTLSMTLKNGSVFTGTVNITENAQNGAAVGDNAVVTVESGCTWSLTGNCTLTSLTNNGSIQFNGYTITLADGTVLQ